jgi:hypothetical protein
LCSWGDVTSDHDNLTTEIDDAESAYRVSPFARCPVAGEPIRCGFCLGP